MAENSAAKTFGKVAFGGAVGFALFFLLRGSALGRGRERCGGSSSPLPPRPVPLPKDEEPLLYVVVESEDAQKLPRPLDLSMRVRRDVRFRRLDLGTAKIAPEKIYRHMSDLLRRERSEGIPPISIDELIARVRAGGRDDVRLISTGDIRHGAQVDAIDTLMGAGIKHWRLWVEAPADRKAGQPPKLPRWELYDKADSVGNPDKLGHYLFQNIGTDSVGNDPHVSGEGRGHYGQQWRQSDGRCGYHQ